MIVSRSTLSSVDDHMRPERVINGVLSTISLYNHDYFHLEGIAMKASRELGSAPIYDSYGPTYNPSHGPKEGERDAPCKPVTLHLSTSSSGTGKPVYRISSKLLSKFQRTTPIDHLISRWIKSRYLSIFNFLQDLTSLNNGELARVCIYIYIYSHTTSSYI